MIIQKAWSVLRTVILIRDLRLTHFSLETPKRLIGYSADPDQTPQNLVSDQGLRGLQTVYSKNIQFYSKPFFSKNIQITWPVMPKIEIRLFQYIVWESLSY